jgi:hypothetical protein
LVMFNLKKLSLSQEVQMVILDPMKSFLEKNKLLVL